MTQFMIDLGSLVHEIWKFMIHANAGMQACIAWCQFELTDQQKQKIEIKCFCLVVVCLVFSV